MPSLKEYAESNDKIGYYVHASISGREHPLPLQTPEITEDIYRELGYQPIEKGPDGGVDVPNELVWTLHNVGLHWTENSGPQEDPSDLDLDKLRDQAGPDLTEQDIQTILSFTKEYKGPYQIRVEDLKEVLGNKSARAVDEGETLSEIVQSTTRESDEPLFSDDVEEMLEQWEPTSVGSEDDESDEGSVFGNLFSTSRSKHREALASVPNLEKCLKEYSDHSLEIQTIKGVEIESENNNCALKILFRADDDSKLNGWRVTDYREIENKQEFEIVTGVKNREFTFEITDNYISDFATIVSHHSVGRFDLPPDDFWGYEVEQQDPNEIMHTLVSDFSHLIPALSEFFDEIPTYSLESIKPYDHSVFLP